MGFVVFILGLVLGSFLGALSYRMPKGINISKGRSVCPKCKKQIAWYDNIPVLSYLLLAGKCRNCKKSISARYPIIELVTALVFVVAYNFLTSILTNIPWLPSNLLLSLGLILLIALLTLLILIVDSEHQIIPDEVVYILFALVVIVMILNGFTPIYGYIATGFCAALFLLMIHLLTGGRGMGLGDVKLAIAIGTILGPISTVVWLFVSFILGGVIGTFLLMLRRAKLKDQVAFGPFLIVSFYIVAIYGQQLVDLLFPYLF